MNRRARSTDLPEKWQALSLGDLAAPNHPICYGIVQVGAPVRGGVPVLAIKNLGTDCRADVHECAPGVEAPYARSRVQPGDVLISVKGTVGRVGIVPLHFTGNISRDLARLRLNGENIPEFWLQMLQSWTGQRSLSWATVGTTRLELSIGVLRQVVLPRPPANEQRAIAVALSDVDGLIDALEALIVKKRAVKQATMQQLLTGRTRLPGFSGEWDRVEVRQVIIRCFCGPSPTCDERNIEGGQEWGVLKTTAATREQGWDWRRHKALPKAYWEQDDKEVRVGDVIITKAGPRHRVGVAAWVDYVPKRIIVSGKMIGLRPDESKVVPLMLAAALSAKETQTFLNQRTTGMAESQVNFENAALLEAPIRLPRIDEQHAISTVLSDMDAEIVALERCRDKTKMIKYHICQSICSRCFFYAIDYFFISV